MILEIAGEGWGGEGEEGVTCASENVLLGVNAALFFVATFFVVS